MYNVQWKGTMCNENVQCAMTNYFSFHTQKLGVQWEIWCAMKNMVCNEKYGVQWKIWCAMKNMVWNDKFGVLFGQLKQLIYPFLYSRIHLRWNGLSISTILFSLQILKEKSPTKIKLLVPNPQYGASNVGAPTASITWKKWELWWTAPPEEL